MITNMACITKLKKEKEKKPTLNQWYFFFNFLMLHHWLESHDGFRTKWQQVFRTTLNKFLEAPLFFFKCYQTKIRIQMWWIFFFPNIWQFFSRKKWEYCERIFPLCFSYFSQHCTLEKNPLLRCIIRDKLYYRIMSLKTEKRTGRQKKSKLFFSLLLFKPARLWQIVSPWFVCTANKQTD